MFARVFSGALLGVEAFVIEVEVDCCAGLGQISIVGLPDTAIREACERCARRDQSLLFFSASRQKVAGQSGSLRCAQGRASL